MRSPIHSMWAEQSYQSPEVESTRVSASSYCSSSASWLVKKSVSAICGVVAELRPQAAMKFSVSSRRAARSW